MIHRPPISESLFASHVEGFEDWKVKAKSATDQACVCQGRNHCYDAKIYGALKPALKVHFAGKCAYCESRFDSVAFGDVEHFRPKKRVDEDDAAAHPGYFWLAYDTVNLLPACELCNRPAKKNRFPIAGPRASKPGDDLAAELPLILNPYVDSDFEPASESVTEKAGLVTARTSPHLGFTLELSEDDLYPTGSMTGLTARGKSSIEVYNLNRPQLVRSRRERQRSAIDRLESRYFREKIEVVADDLSNPCQDSSAAVRAVVLAWRWLQKNRLDRI